MALEEPETKRFKHSTIDDRIYGAEFQETFVKHWHSSESMETPDLSIIQEPFRVCKISNFIKSEAFMDELKNELSDVKSRRQSTDLYQFEQTSDLANVESKNLRRLWETFQSDLSVWMEKNTRVELDKKISMSSACYYDTDYLLCHDDNMGDRRIAFILYLSKNWTPEDGGSLDLFDTDENGLPRNIVRSLVPEYNSLVFFEVVDNSYHQVAEVKSSEKSRWTINGWFHGPPRAINNRRVRPEQEMNFVRPDKTLIVKLDAWIANSYLLADIVKEIQKSVESESYTFLSNFLKSDVYDRLSGEIASDSIIWKRVGPADVRNYEIAEPQSLPGTLQDFYRMFQSIEAFRLLKDYTELDLVPEPNCMDPKMSIELQRWSSGCYTLICDRQISESYCRASEINLGTAESTAPTSNGDSCVTHLSSRSRIGEVNSNGTRDSSSSNSSDDDDDENEEDEENALKRILDVKLTKSERKSFVNSSPNEQASCSKLEGGGGGSSKVSSTKSAKPAKPANPDSEDSDVSDIGDYLSDPFDCSVECSENEHESSVAGSGTLDVIIQFNTSKTISENDTIDYVDPREQDDALIHVPAKDNHLCLVYKTLGTSRLHKYVNHYCRGYFYNLICTYYE